jgi:predicted secreted protein
MSLTTAVAAFFLIWWVTLFAVLPWGVHSQHEGGDMTPGTDPGAPASFPLGRKLLWTTAIALLIYGVCYGVYSRHLVTLAGLMGPFDYKKY